MGEEGEEAPQLVSMFTATTNLPVSKITHMKN